MKEPKPTIKYEDFVKIDMRIGTVVLAEEIEESEKLIKMEIDFGDLGVRQIIAGIKAWYKPEDIRGKQLPFILNIEPKKMMGFESQGMLLAIESGDGVKILLPDESVENGSFLS